MHVSGPHEHTTLATSGLSAAIYLLPVPLSNCSPADVLPQYNLDIIKQIKYFVVENVRTARRFLKAVDKTIDIDSLTFVELNEHTPESDINDMLSPVKAGNAVGVMSEAGCPAVADPGALLVAQAQRSHIAVIPLVGPSSILLALMGSGFNGQNFAFHGYLPIDEKTRVSTLRNMATDSVKKNITHIFIETPYRNKKLIETMLATLPGDTKICIASDITGINQSILTKSVYEWKKSEINYDKVPTIFLIGQ